MGFVCFSGTGLKTFTLVSEIQHKQSPFLPTTFISHLNREQVKPIASKLMSRDGKIKNLHGKGNCLQKNQCRGITQLQLLIVVDDPKGGGLSGNHFINIHCSV